ncbi:condensation domain-containing protein [Catelliglobosispora koreensis]|uniref:condensation domain-containing protein n=1 Tax=Catelliglobosispora koreensis TaxID=129052 RepID=UPI001FDEDC1C|nr:condensation domain-containing protein [Catelliglobosispora koreensis]
METTETYDVPASVSQRLLWMIKHYRTDYGALNCPVVCRVRGSLDLDAFQRAVNDLAARHDSLRTTFQGRGPRLSQRIHAPRPEPVVLEDLSTHDDPSTAADKALAQELSSPIDPQQWPVRARLWRITAREHLFCLNLHHLVTDAWSTGILLRDLCLLYDIHTGGTASLAPLGWSPREFVEWQKALLAGDRLKRHQDYWRRQLAGARLPQLTSAPPASAASASGAAVSGAGASGASVTGGVGSGGSASTGGGASGGLASGASGAGAEDGAGLSGVDGAARVDTVDLPARVVSGLRDLAKREQTTPFTVLLALFQAQLHRVTGQGDISVASMFANRTRPELRETVGLLAGMVLLRADVAAQRSFTDLVRHCHKAVLGAFTYSELPFQLLPTNLVDTGGGRADNVMFNVMTETQHLRTGGGVHFELVVPTDIGSRFPFELALVPVGESAMKAALFRAPDQLEAAGGEAFLRGFAALAAAVVDEPDARLAGLLTTSADA